MRDEFNRAEALANASASLSATGNRRVEYLLTGLSLSQEEIFKHLDELGQEAELDSEGYGKLRQRIFEKE